MDKNLWTEVCGRKFVDGTEVCGRKFVDGSESVFTTPSPLRLNKSRDKLRFLFNKQVHRIKKCLYGVINKF